MIYVLSLEPLEERYTKQWDAWFRAALDSRGCEYRLLRGAQLTDHVETGVVLDCEGTNYWKFSQLLEVCELFKSGAVRPGDVFLTMDLWHPGLEAIPYMACLENIPVRIFGFLHAGSYTSEDFAAPMSRWARFFERGWAEICDGVFVGTQYHKDKFLSLRYDAPGDVVHSRVHVTGNPFSCEDVRNLALSRGPILPPSARDMRIVFPHRFDAEKRPGVMMDMLNSLWKSRQDFRVTITTSRPTLRSNAPELLARLASCEFPLEVKAGLSKAEYYRELASARVFLSTTIEENFGYCLLESINLGCSPVVPDGYSHPELLSGDSRFLYRGVDEGIGLLDHFLDHPVDVSNYAQRYDQSIDRMLDLMGV